VFGGQVEWDSDVKQRARQWAEEMSERAHVWRESGEVAGHEEVYDAYYSYRKAYACGLREGRVVDPFDLVMNWRMGDGSNLTHLGGLFNDYEGIDSSPNCEIREAVVDGVKVPVVGIKDHVLDNGDESPIQLTVSYGQRMGSEHIRHAAPPWVLFDVSMKTVLASQQQSRPVTPPPSHHSRCNTPPPPPSKSPGRQKRTRPDATVSRRRKRPRNEEESEESEDESEEEDDDSEESEEEEPMEDAESQHATAQVDWGTTMLERIASGAITSIDARTFPLSVRKKAAAMQDARKVGSEQVLVFATTPTVYADLCAPEHDHGTAAGRLNELIHTAQDETHADSAFISKYLCRKGDAKGPTFTWYVLAGLDVQDAFKDAARRFTVKEVDRRIKLRAFRNQVGDLARHHSTCPTCTIPLPDPTSPDFLQRTEDMFNAGDTSQPLRRCSCGCARR